MKINKYPKKLKEYNFYSFKEQIAEDYKNKIAYSTYADDDKDITYSSLKNRVDRVSTYLLSRGLKKGDRVAIFSPSSSSWMVCYLAIVSVGLVAVPILSEFSERESQSIIKESGAKVVFVSQKVLAKIEGIIKERSLLAINIETFIPLEGEKSILTCEINKSLLDSSIATDSDIASLIFTSGTTGKSKGVVLTHKNLLYSADEASLPYIKIKRGYNVLSILPMSHVYEFTLGHILPLMMGCHITLLGKVPSANVLLPAVKKVRPEIIMTVPLIIEKVYKASIKPILEKKEIKRLTSFKLGKIITYTLICKKLVATLGGRLKFFGIGGAPLDRETEEFLFLGGFPYALGYGLTETSPLISACGPRRGQHKMGKIGKIVNGLELKILNPNKDGIGEVCVKGPSVMEGYYRNDELNKNSFTDDGYFKTGDLGVLDKHGLIGLRGRKKTMILSSSGENIYPEEIEELINKKSFVEESLVIEKNGVLTALVKIDIAAISRRLKLSLIDAKREAKRYLEEVKKEVNSEVSSFSRLSSILLTEVPFERTPTMKIKRYLY